MVKSGLADRVDVSQYRLVAHLALALAIYGVTLWIALGLWISGSAAVPAAQRGQDARATNYGWGWRRLAEMMIALVALTIVAGGFVAGLKAGLTYNTFPLMDGSLIPAGYAALEPFVRNWFENVAAVQFDHRLLASLAALSAVGLWLAGMRTALPYPMRWALHAVVAAAALQFGLGISTLLLVVPIPLAAAHQAGAVLFLSAAIVFRHALRKPSP
jgi:cytochrome c oxidase assembly protein subunit 15